MSKLFNSVGIPCGHESIFTPDGLIEARQRLDGKSKIVSSVVSGSAECCNIEADSSYMAAPFLSLFKDATIIHVVRNPIDVINSLLCGFCYFLSGSLECGVSDEYWQYEYPPGADHDFRYHSFIYSHLPRLTSPMLPVNRAALFYLYWNSMIEPWATIRHQIENSPKELLRQIGKDNNDFIYEPTNKSEYSKKYTIDDISEEIRYELLDMAERYGYGVA